MHISTLDEMGGLDLLGTPKVDNQYHAGLSVGGQDPLLWDEAARVRPRRDAQPEAIRWPAKITPGATPRLQFHHCNDIVPTIYEIVGITPPREVNGIPQDPIDAVSFAYALNDPDAPGRLVTQYFEIMGSRAIYHDGWMASATGPRLPWVAGRPPGIEDWTQADDLAGEMPDKLAQMKETFAIEAARNSVYPVGGGLWIVVLHPELRISMPYREWNLGPDIIRMPEFWAPALGNRANLVTIDADLREHANGVLYALGSSSGGLTAYLDDGYLGYEYNLFILMRTKIRTQQRFPADPAKIEISTEYAEVKPGDPLNITISVNDEQVGSGTVPVSAPLLFTANDCLDIGTLPRRPGLPYKPLAWACTPSVALRRGYRVKLAHRKLAVSGSQLLPATSADRAKLWRSRCVCQVSRQTSRASGRMVVSRPQRRSLRRPPSFSTLTLRSRWAA
jgi:hypothetical protein